MLMGWHAQEKHLKELAEMRVASQEAEKRHKSELDARAAARAAAIASALPTWESHILPNWRTVLHSDSQGRSLRSLWWQGTMPVRFRGRLWAMCIGNGLTVPKSAYFQALGRAKRGLEEGRKDMKRVQEEAEEDSQRTLPTLKLFQRGGVMHEDLMDLLLAWSVYEKVSPRYPQGLAYPAALLLVNMPVQEAFVSLVNIVKKSFLRSFYGDDPEEVEAYYRVFDTLLADTMPRVYASFSAAVVRPSLYLFPWLTTLYVHFLPLDLSTRLFDVFLLEGDSFMFRTALVLLQILEPRLFNPNLEELGAVFRGEDKGAVAVVRREKGLLTADGGSVEERDGGVRIEVEDVYAEMGASEERVFELLGALEWKEETWERLVERELPEAD
ncbi:SPOSA6832_04830 [Sporobolomyces salmonicolor]|uniref:SPOSA6832_04830-mRNA-1:cds n=1 Tax=Sporidiobolus salmonicolor TaxID=5005 RepID=A0A0D6ESY7_SPOSA|nr:SPOSA6832_04830 [Sporobolomyces salmonicolor]